MSPYVEFDKTKLEKVDASFVTRVLKNYLEMAENAGPREASV